METYRTIVNLHNEYSYSLDKILARSLRQDASTISKPIAHVVNECFAAGKFPNKLKRAKLISIYKGECKNYKIVSILKIFESNL